MKRLVQMVIQYNSKIELKGIGIDHGRTIERKA